MKKYKITIEEVIEKELEKYHTYERVYEQVINEGELDIVDVIKAVNNLA